MSSSEMVSRSEFSFENNGELSGVAFAIDPNSLLAKHRNPERFIHSDEETIKRLYGLM